MACGRAGGGRHRGEPLGRIAGAWEAEAISDWLTSIVPRIEAFGGAETPLRQILCNEYDAGIGWHRDKPRFDGVFGLSLGSAGRFRGQ
jgi:alkylated DNA repair dioxygenase AlkB